MIAFPSVRVRHILLAASLTSYVGIASGQSLTIPSPPCSDLVTGSDEITIGEVCTEVVGDYVEVTITISDEIVSANGCCLKETHICNYPARSYNTGADCRANYTYNLPIDELEMFGFVCESDCQDMFQLDGHATILCDGKALPFDDKPYGDPLEGGVGTGNYPVPPEGEFFYGAMFWIMFTCEGCGQKAPCIPESHTEIDYTAKTGGATKSRRALKSKAGKAGKSGKSGKEDSDNADDEDKALCNQALGQNDKYCYTLEFEGCSEDDILEGCYNDMKLPTGFPYTCNGQNYTLSAALYVDCHDEFPFGYGEFGAPVFMEGSRLRSYRLTKLKDPGDPDCSVDKVCYGTICGDNKVCVPEQQKIKFEDDSYVPESIEEICNKTGRSDDDDRYLYLEFETGEIFERFFDKDGTSNGVDLVFEVGNFTLTGLHLSCSDKYEGGYGQKGPPNQADGHPRIVEYQIAKLEDKDDKPCRVVEICYGCPAPEPEGTDEPECPETVKGDDLPLSQSNEYKMKCLVAGASAMKHYYELSFEGGYEASGWTEANTVDVTATGTQMTSIAIQDVHISCSDKFPGGYGEKGGPTKTDGDPPVEEVLIIKYKDVSKCEIDKVCRYCPEPEPEGTEQQACVDNAKRDELPPVEVSQYENICTEAGAEAMKYYYDFTFESNGGITSTAIGWSQDNTVDPMNAQPFGDIDSVHVSCSDKFPGGYGEKGGPMEKDGEPQVEEFLIVKYKDDARNCVVDKVCRYCPPEP